MVIDKDQARFWNKEAKRFTSIGDLPIAATAGGNAAFEKLICDWLESLLFFFWDQLANEYGIMRTVRVKSTNIGLHVNFVTRL